MKALILAAGKGTRLRPLTYGIPKPLLPIKGTPMIDLVIRSISGIRLDEIIVAIPGSGTDDMSKLHGKCINTYLQNVYGEKIVTIGSPQKETGGDIKYVLDNLGIDSGKLLVVYGDNLTSFDIAKMVEYHNKCRQKIGSKATVLLFKAPKKELNRFGIADISKSGGLSTINKFIEKPPQGKAPSRLANGGYYILEVEDMRGILPTSGKMEIEVFPHLAAEGKLSGYITKIPYWIDVSTLEAYEKANKMAHKGLIISPS